MTARLSVIGGYLGAGKTTLINRLLDGMLPGRTAVIVNDFGSVNIDADLIASASDDTIQLTNGCMCCQLNDDVVTTMTALASRSDVDQVICEISGVGFPEQLASWGSFPGFIAGSIIICADATVIAELVRDQYVGDTVTHQLRSGDAIIVTKTDLASENELRSAIEICSSLNPAAEILVQGRSEMLESLTARLATSSRWTCETRPSSWGVRKGVETEVSSHADAVHYSSTINIKVPVDLAYFTSVLKNQRHRLIRAKGIVKALNGEWYEVQLSGGKVDIRKRPDRSATPKEPGIVLISRGENAGMEIDRVRAALSGQGLQHS